MVPPSPDGSLEIRKISGSANVSDDLPGGEIGLHRLPSMGYDELLGLDHPLQLVGELAHPVRIDPNPPGRVIHRDEPW